MNSFERFSTALSKKQPDKVPILSLLNPLTDNWASREKSYSKLLDAVLDCGDVLFEVGPIYNAGLFHSMYPINVDAYNDNRFLKMVYHTKLGELSEIVSLEHAGYTAKHLIETEQDVNKLLSVPDCSPSINEYYTKELISKYTDCIVPFFKMKDPMCHVGDSISPDTLAIWTIENREMILELLDLALSRTLKTIDYLASTQIKGIFYFSGPEYAIPPLCSPNDFKDFVVKYDKIIVEKIHSYGMHCILHSHGKVREFLDDYVEIGNDGLDVLEPDYSETGNINLLEVKEKYGDKICLIGNMQYDDIVYLSNKEIEARIERIVSEGSPKGGFILENTADPWDIPLDDEICKKFVFYYKCAKKYCEQAYK